MSFIGRKHELEDLHAELTSEKQSLVIVYGRRRIGKSTLLQKAAEANFPRRHMSRYGKFVGDLSPKP